MRKELDGLAATAKYRFGRSMQISALMATVRELFSEEDIRPIIIFQTDVDQIRALQPPHDKMPQARHLPYNFDYVLSETEKSGATVYSIFPGVRYLGIPREEQLKRSEVDIRTSNPNYVEPLFGFSKDVRQWLDKRLKQQQSSADIANVTGGFTRFLERPEQAETIYSDIFNDLNNRYVVGYYPTNKTRDGKRRQIKISIKNHPEYTIWGRNSYRAPVE